MPDRWLVLSSSFLFSEAVGTFCSFCIIIIISRFAGSHIAVLVHLTRTPIVIIIFLAKELSFVSANKYCVCSLLTRVWRGPLSLPWTRVRHGTRFDGTVIGRAVPHSQKMVAWNRLRCVVDVSLLRPHRDCLLCQNSMIDPSLVIP